MAALTPVARKRPLEGEDELLFASTIPKGDLTYDRIDEWMTLNDRQKICWALQTECRVRLNKLENRGSNERDNTCTTSTNNNGGVLSQNNKNKSKVLQDGNYLFEVYPSLSSSSSSTLMEDENEDNKCNKKKASTNINMLQTKKETIMMSSPVSSIQRDLHEFHRKSSQMFHLHRSLDESWSNIPPLTIKGYERFENCLNSPSSLEEDQEEEDEDNHKKDNDTTYTPAPVPPNMLFFRIILEGYMGYKWPRFHSSNGTMPRGAVMGGAVVASLTAWRDRRLVHIFQKEHIEDVLLKVVETNDKKEKKKYKRLRTRLIREVNRYFIYKYKYSTFADGDVDVFLQASPFTRNLLQYLQQHRGMDLLLIHKISEYMGGLDFVQDGLHRTMTQVVEATNTERYPYKTGLVHAIACNGISFQYAKESDEPDPKTWPRTTQAIMLRPEADLLCGLLDFDISVVTCAYDGNGVHVAPRAALGLITLSFVVTPFILQEQRNRKRIVKYWKRGFTPYLVDPYCLHTKRQCCPSSLSLTLEKGVSPFVSVRQSWRRDAEQEGAVNDIDDGSCSRTVIRHKSQPEYYKAMDLVSSDRMKEVTEYQKEYGKVLCCDSHHKEYGLFSFVLFELKENDAMIFFETFNQWTSEFKNEVESYDPRLRVACRYCRTRYLMHRVLSSLPNEEDDNSEYDTNRKNSSSNEGNDDDTHYSITRPVEDIYFVRNVPAAHGWSESGKAGFVRLHQQLANFYCGPTFDPRLAQITDEAYHLGHAVSHLHSKERMEKVRYEITHGRGRNLFGDTYNESYSRIVLAVPPPSSPESEAETNGAAAAAVADIPKTYQKRFVFHTNLDCAFEEASEVLFPKPKRSPVGLNPERFMTRCQSCRLWLIGCEFNVTDCEQCTMATQFKRGK